jgi:hypothetical protein
VAASTVPGGNEETRCFMGVRNESSDPVAFTTIRKTDPHHVGNGLSPR